jgi:hypothetical protein
VTGGEPQSLFTPAGVTDSSDGYTAHWLAAYAVLLFS